MFRSELSLLSTQAIISVNQDNFFFFLSPWLRLFDHALRFSFTFQIHLNKIFWITSDSIELYPSMQWWSANVARFRSFLFLLLQFAPFSFSFQNPDLRLPNHAWFVSWVCRSDWFCQFRSTVGDLRALAFFLIWFSFSFFFMHMGDGNKCLNLSIELIQVIGLGVLLHVIFISWLSWGAMLVVSHFIALNWS